MTGFLVILHVVVSLALILIVLLQTGRGANIGAAFGAGSSQTLFGSRGGGTFFGKLTAAVAIIFMLTSLGLSFFSSQRLGDSVMTGVEAPPAQEAPAPAQTPPPPLTPKEQAQPIRSPAGETE